MKFNNDAYKKIYEDDHIVIINKAPGVLSIPDRYDITKENLRSLLEDKYGEIFVVHRLDKNTSGIMVFAKNAAAHKNLNMQFEENEVEKLYYALVLGNFAKRELDIDIPILPHSAKKGLAMPSARGKPSLTKVKLIEAFDGYSLLECNIVTGRFHQIRVHLSTIDHPLIVDPEYGGEEAFFVSSVKKRFYLKKGTEEKPLIDRLTMHAFKLKFKHPVSNEEVEFEAEIPKDFSALLQVLRKYRKYD